ncbi:MAG TPA: hypothetical protein VJU16_02270 [Planctomycetota bacterium]|nr:hypothetical protein [Planctomycetota bacterium]
MKLFAALAVVAVCGSTFAQEGPSDPARKVRDKIATLKITLDFKDARLDEVIAYFQEFSGLNFHLDADARAKEIADGSKVTIKLKDVTLRTALKLVLNPRDLGCVYREGVIVIATKAGMGSQTVTRVYDVRDLLFQIQDFPGPKFELDAQKPGLDPTLWLQEEPPKAAITEDMIADLIKASTGDRAWDDSATSIQQINGLLVISQTRSGHDEVRRFLDLLRQYK